MSQENNSLSDSSLTAKILDVIKQTSIQSQSAAGFGLHNFKQKGSQHQFDLLHKVDSLLGEIEASVSRASLNLDEEFDLKLLEEPLSKARFLLKERVKHLRIAEEGGWLAVQKYQGASDIGDDQEDAKRIQRCIDDARVEARRLSKQKPRPYDVPAASTSTASGCRYIRGSFPKDPQGPSQDPPTRFNSQCFKCGRYGHWRFECRATDEVPKEKLEKIKAVCESTVQEKRISARKLAGTAGSQEMLPSSLHVPDAASQDVKDVAQNLREFLAESKAEKTFEVYLRISNKFQELCVDEIGVSNSHLNIVWAAVAWVHQLAGIYSPTLNPMCKLAADAARRRAGGATAAAASGVSEQCLQRHGRWKSVVVKDGYVSSSLSEELSVTKGF